jgi:hypothetical protein
VTAVKAFLIRISHRAFVLLEWCDVDGHVALVSEF